MIIGLGTLNKLNQKNNQNKKKNNYSSRKRKIYHRNKHKIIIFKKIKNEEKEY